ncbi:DUF1203 domain-containing protein [Kiloniella antarctica]|uniref:DUF1203 domain-containing protein n=1 Tax=Kiloniella antarctica TaxID=1550907 RepID=A0ABW5BS48_9PROT
MTDQNTSRVRFLGIPNKKARLLQCGGHDENGQKPERMISDGSGFPCRHCLKPILNNEGVLVLSYRPFEDKQPYAETGPIFLHSDLCEEHQDNEELPDNIRSQGNTLLRGYNADNRIVYGTGQTVKSETVKEAALDMFKNEKISYIHARSTTNNCFTCRIERT